MLNIARWNIIIYDVIGNFIFYCSDTHRVKFKIEKKSRLYILQGRKDTSRMIFNFYYKKKYYTIKDLIDKFLPSGSYMTNMDINNYNIQYIDHD